MPSSPHDPRHDPPHDSPGRTVGAGPLSDVARRALLAAGAAYRAAAEALQTAVCHYVDGLRREGAPRDAIAASVRRFVADLRTAGWGAAVPSGADDARLDQLVDECLARGTAAP